MNYKYIIIEQRNFEVFEEMPVYRVFNKKVGDQIAMIYWYKPWGKYVFSTKEGCVFDRVCMSDITDFMHTLENSIKKPTNNGR